MFGSPDKIAKALRTIVVEAWRIRHSISETSPVRILHLIETGGPGGAERMMLDLSRNLGNGYDSTICLLKDGWLKSQVLESKISCELLTSNGLGDLGVVASLVQLARNKRAHLIHAHEFYMNAIGSVVSFLTGIPLIATVHGKSYYPEKKRRCAVYRMVAARAAGMVAVSQDLQSFFCKTIRIATERVQVVYNGIDTKSLSNIPRNLKLLESIGVPTDASIVGTVGNLYPVKGHIHLIRAASMILQHRPYTHVLILGRGGQRDALLAEAKTFGIEDHIHLLGYREDAPDWLGMMHVFTLPSLSEGLPLSLLEAMAVGIPTVVSAVGGMPEAVCDGHSGFLVPPGDPDALAKQILFLLNNPAVAASVGNAGRKRVQEDFSLNRMVREYCSLYQRALNRIKNGRSLREPIS
jgi:glycosyltransferase involved in cell wall biosynthesis